MAILPLATPMKLPDTVTMIPDSLKHELKQRATRAVTTREAAVDVMKELQEHYGWLLMKQYLKRP